MIYKIEFNQMNLVEGDWASVTPWPLQQALRLVSNSDYWRKDICWEVVKSSKSGKVYLHHIINEFTCMTIHCYDDRYVIAVWEKSPNKRVIARKFCKQPEQIADIAYTMMDEITNENLFTNMTKPHADSLIYAIFDRAITDYIYALERGDKGELLSIERFLREMNRYNLISYAKERHRKLYEERKKELL